ncbi:MAG: serine/threonine protein kinase [Deltaproteobacteria bacterium]|nr:serine/threonine protein kinase [Deltaproteobacteria bacterium]
MDQLGSYRLRKRLAVGGMGEVYLGEKIGPEGFVKPVVLKCVLPQLASDRAFVQLFLDEARLAALLNHPNIAQVYDFGLVDDVYYIAMEYVPGYTVDDIRRKLRSIKQFMPMQHIACIASQVCQGLQYAHMLTDANGVSLGLVHRDVSPHNLIVSIDGSVKIVDFGIAKARAGLTRVQAKGAVGKFGYMSPEQARGEVVDGRSDVFSLGICLWELTTNERLHDPNLDRAPNYQPTRPVRSVEEFRHELPRQFVNILETALAIQPEDRYRTSQDMHLALERFQAAMTHYAGQSALAGYIKDLVEGRIENPEGGNAGGSMVEPKGGNSPRGTTENMDAAQKYEEVFGVTMNTKRRPTLKAVPKSWETKSPPPEPARPAPTPSSQTPPKAGPRMVELRSDGGTGDIPEIAGPPVQRVQRRHTPLPVRVQKTRSKLPLVIILMLVVLGGGGFFAFQNKEQLLALVKGGSTQPSAGSKLTCLYRVETEPPGATVFLDGVPHEGQTPLVVELIPDVEYRLQVRLPKFATHEQRLKATVAETPRPLRYKLDPAGSLQITSVPTGGTVTIDSMVIDDKVTPMTLDDFPANREVKVKVEVKGIPPMTKSIEVPAGKKKALKFDLDQG